VVPGWLDKNGVYLNFGSGDDIAEILVFDIASLHGVRPRVHTSEGVQTGTKIERLKEIYGTKLHKTYIDGEGGPMTAYVLFGPAGALIFVESEDGSEGNFVGSMRAVRGTTMKTLDLRNRRC
jgi:hypothetical protein